MPLASTSESWALTSEGRASEVERLIAPSIAAMGFDIVRVQLSGKQRVRLQIMVERLGGGDIVLDECAGISRAVSAILDVEDPILGPYALEVSSPGLDRPLTRAGDFERFAGLEAKVEMRGPIDGRKRFRGRLVGLQEGLVKIATDDGEFALPVAELVKAKLVLTDQLLAARRGAARDRDESRE